MTLPGNKFYWSIKEIHVGGHITNRCDQCDYQSKLKGTLAEHKITKHGDRKFHCNKCDYISTHKQSLLKHQQSSYADEDIAKHRKNKHDECFKFQCDQCDYKSKEKRLLIMHKKTKHEGFRFKCEKCNYSCIDRGSYSRHKKVAHSWAKIPKFEHLFAMVLNCTIYSYDSISQ